MQLFSLVLKKRILDKLVKLVIIVTESKLMAFKKQGVVFEYK